MPVVPLDQRAHARDPGLHLPERRLASESVVEVSEPHDVEQQEPARAFADLVEPRRGGIVGRLRGRLNPPRATETQQGVAHANLVAIA